MARGVDRRAVVERVGVGSELNPVVAPRSTPRGDTAAGERRQGVDLLVVLVVVDEVAALDDGVGAQRADGRCGTGQHLGGQRLLGSEGRLKGRTEGIEEADARRGGGVEHVRVREMGERGEGLPVGGRRSQLRAGAHRFAGRHPELAVADRVAPRGLPGGAGGSGPPVAAAAAGEAQGQCAGTGHSLGQHPATGHLSARPHLTPPARSGRIGGRPGGRPTGRPRRRRPADRPG